MRGQGVEGLEVVNVSFLQELLYDHRRAGPRAAAALARSAPAPRTTSRSWRACSSPGAARPRASPSPASCSTATRNSTPTTGSRSSAFSRPSCSPTPMRVAAAAQAYLDDPGDVTLAAPAEGAGQPAARNSSAASTWRPAPPPRSSPCAATCLRLRSRTIPRSPPSTRDLTHGCCTSWFNRGFLVLRRIDWQTPAAILEKIIRYEAVHEIQGWDDLRRRLDPADRRCFAFFHPSLVDEPLDLRRGGADAATSPSAIRRGAARSRKTDAAADAADHGRVLFDLQLPGRSARHLVRQLPD